MSDDSNQTPQNSGANITPASNQNLIIGLVMGAAILLLLFLVVSNQRNNSSPSNEVDDLKDRIAELKRNENATFVQQNLGAGANNYGVDPMKLAEEISTEANTLAGLIGDFSSTIQQKDALLQTARDTESLLNRRIQDLQRQMNDLSSSAAEAVTMRQELESLRTLYANAQRQIEELRKRPDAATVEELRRQNDELRSRLLALGDLDKENRELREEVRRLQALLDRSKLFVEDANALPDIAKRLFRELQRLEDYEPAQLADQYKKIEQQLSATPLRSINFATGSAQLTSEKISIIKNDLAETHPGAFLLVVGYASTIGDQDANRKLSSARATAVASQVNLDKKGTQDVRAVFLSETNRFSKEQATLNQICEIWEIRP
ncbi:MAG: OmpA family protein [Roseibacillus sp.]